VKFNSWSFKFLAYNLFMKKQADITLLVDRSGSMQIIKEDAEGGIKNLIEEQKKDGIPTVFSLVQFDNEYEFVYKGVDISDVKEYILIPRGRTALIDSVGRVINETGERLSKLDESERPELVIIAIVTDGKENSSEEFTSEKVKEMISRQQQVYNWQFVYIGADQDSFEEAGAIGIHANSVANYSKQNTELAYSVVSNNLTRMKSSMNLGEKVKNEFKDEERASIE